MFLWATFCYEEMAEHVAALCRAEGRGGVVRRTDDGWGVFVARVGA